MSALNSFRILSKKDNIVIVEVCLIHPDEHHINNSYNFALQILVELYEFVKLGYLHSFAHSPLSKEAHEKLLLEENKPLLENLLALMRYDNPRNQPNYDAFCEQADTHIALLEVLEVDNFPHWVDRFETWLKYQKKSYEITNEECDENPESNEIPSYQLQITVNPKSSFLLNHVVEGCSWKSAAFNFYNYGENYTPKKEAIYYCLNYSTDIIPPTDEILQNWWNNLDNVWKHIFWENLEIQKYELPNYIVEHFELPTMPKLLKDIKQEISLQDLRLISQLKYLNANFESGIKDISCLSILKGLKILELSNTYFTDISILKDLSNLESLNIYGNDNITDISVLKNLVKLQYLRFFPKKQEDLKDILFLKNLREIEMGTLSFEFDYAIFEQFPKLKKLSAYATSDAGIKILKNLHEKGVEVQWNIYDEENDDWIFVEF